MPKKPSIPEAARAYLAGIGANGGKKKSKAKEAAVLANLAAARAKRWPKKAVTEKP